MGVPPNHPFKWYSPLETIYFGYPHGHGNPQDPAFPNSLHLEQEDVQRSPEALAGRSRPFVGSPHWWLWPLWRCSWLPWHLPQRQRLVNDDPLVFGSCQLLDLRTEDLLNEIRRPGRSGEIYMDASRVLEINNHHAERIQKMNIDNYIYIYNMYVCIRMYIYIYIHLRTIVMISIVGPAIRNPLALSLFRTVEKGLQSDRIW